jgi:serine/threonine-protein kinase
VRDLVAGDTLDGYRIAALLARGGMAAIFEAVDEESGETVALKVPHIQYEADVVFWERFRREEEMALRLDHPNLVKARAPRREKSRVYLIMEYVEGTSLAALLGEGRPLDAAEAVDIARQTCDALAYLHGQGVVHRDVKPGNVLLTPRRQVKLLDFGISHLGTARRLTISGLSASIGTPDYMAPEQLRGRAGDARVDLYALGTMLYEMLTGRLPYAGSDWETRARAKRLEDPTPASALLPGIDPALEGIVMRAIAPGLADRYGTAAELLIDLRNPSAAAPRAGARWNARPRRRIDPMRVAAAVAVVVALCGVGGIAWLSHRRIVETAAANALDRTAGAATLPPAPSPHPSPTPRRR